MQQREPERRLQVMQQREPERGQVTSKATDGRTQRGGGGYKNATERTREEVTSKQ